MVEKSDGIQLYPGVWEECHEVVQREVLHKAVGKVAGSKKDITRKHIESVRNLLFFTGWTICGTAISGAGRAQLSWYFAEKRDGKKEGG